MPYQRGARQKADRQRRKPGQYVEWWLVKLEEERPDEAAGLLRYWWDGKAERAERLLHWFSFAIKVQPDNELFKLCEDIISSLQHQLFRNHGRNPLPMLLRSWGETLPEICGQLLQSFFESWFVFNPGRIPFEKYELEIIDNHSLSEFANKAPQAFLQGATDALVHSVDMVVAEGENGKYWYGFKDRTYKGYRFGFDRFLGIYRSALKKCAQETPEAASLYLNKLDPHKHQSLMHLYLGNA